MSTTKSDELFNEFLALTDEEAAKKGAGLLSRALKLDSKHIPSLRSMAAIMLQQDTKSTHALQLLRLAVTQVQTLIHVPVCVHNEYLFDRTHDLPSSTSELDTQKVDYSWLNHVVIECRETEVWKRFAGDACIAMASLAFRLADTATEALTELAYFVILGIKLCPFVATQSLMDAAEIFSTLNQPKRAEEFFFLAAKSAQDEFEPRSVRNPFTVGSEEVKWLHHLVGLRASQKWVSRHPAIADKGSVQTTASVALDRQRKEVTAALNTHQGDWCQAYTQLCFQRAPPGRKTSSPSISSSSNRAKQSRGVKPANSSACPVKPTGSTMSNSSKTSKTSKTSLFKQRMEQKSNNGKSDRSNKPINNTRDAFIDPNAHGSGGIENKEKKKRCGAVGCEVTAGTGAGVTLQRCRKCKSVYYCCRACQVAHWPTHKIECRNLSTLSTAGTGASTTRVQPMSGSSAQAGTS